MIDNGRRRNKLIHWKFSSLTYFLCIIIFLYHQYFANGDAWHLPDGAYETISLLKEAGGHTHQVFPSHLLLSKDIVIQ